MVGTEGAVVAMAAVVTEEPAVLEEAVAGMVVEVSTKRAYDHQRVAIAADGGGTTMRMLTTIQVILFRQALNLVDQLT